MISRAVFALLTLSLCATTSAQTSDSHTTTSSNQLNVNPLLFSPLANATECAPSLTALNDVLEECRVIAAELLGSSTNTTTSEEYCSLNDELSCASRVTMTSNEVSTYCFSEEVYEELNTTSADIDEFFREAQLLSTSICYTGEDTGILCVNRISELRILVNAVLNEDINETIESTSNITTEIPLLSPTVENLCADECFVEFFSRINELDESIDFTPELVCLANGEQLCYEETSRLLMNNDNNDELFFNDGEFVDDVCGVCPRKFLATQAAFGEDFRDLNTIVGEFCSFSDTVIELQCGDLLADVISTNTTGQMDGVCGALNFSDQLSCTNECAAFINTVTDDVMCCASVLPEYFAMNTNIGVNADAFVETYCTNTSIPERCAPNFDMTVVQVDVENVLADYFANNADSVCSLIEMDLAGCFATTPFYVSCEYITEYTAEVTIETRLNIDELELVDNAAAGQCAFTNLNSLEFCARRNPLQRVTALVIDVPAMNVSSTSTPVTTATPTATPPATVTPTATLTTTAPEGDDESGVIDDDDDDDDNDDDDDESSAIIANNTLMCVMFCVASMLISV